MSVRILVVEDEAKWQENYRAWIDPSIGIQDVAESAAAAVAFLRRFHYDLVILDLSMDVDDMANRDTNEIQKYLSGRPEGTLYIVISANARKDEVRDAGFRLGAFWVLFKIEADPVVVNERVAAAIAESGHYGAKAIAEARGLLIADAFQEAQMFALLRPRGGPTAMFTVLDVLFRAVAPIGLHLERPRFAITEHSIVALVWSRQLGTAVSCSLANREVAEGTALDELAGWLGFPSRGAEILDRDVHRVRVRIFGEPSISDVHFALPQISGKAGV